MNNIDFLPKTYRRRGAERNKKMWWLTVLAIFGGVTFATAAIQYGLRQSVHYELAQVEALHAAAEAKRARLHQLNSELAVRGHSADLYAYLQHPWPATRLVQLAVEPLTEGVALTELKIIREAAPNETIVSAPAFLNQEEEEAALAAMTPAQRDLIELREMYDGQLRVVYLEGVTNDAAELHQFLAKLDRSGLLVKTELRSVEQVDDKKRVGVSRFRVRLVIAPGYGQPGAREFEQKDVATTSWIEKARNKP